MEVILEHAEVVGPLCLKTFLKIWKLCFYLYQPGWFTRLIQPVKTRLIMKHKVSFNP